MRDGILAAIGGAIVVALLVLTITISIKVDHDAPVIEFTETISYDDSQSISSLLKGVKAYDDKDGDVTGSVMVESLIVLEDLTQAKVTYTAKDSNNNVSKASRIIDYSGAGNSIFTSSTVINGNEIVETMPVSTESSQPETTAPVEPDTEETTPEETTPEETTPEETTVNDNPAAPVMTMLAREGSIKVGGYFNVASYVSNIVDDVDSRDVLYTRIGIEGRYDSSTPGDYIFKVYCIDTDKNFSNMESFTLHVVNE